MTPKTTKHKRVAQLSATLPPLSDKQLAYATKHCFDHKAVKRANGYVCTHCGNVSKTAEKKCPNCGYEVTVLETRNRRIKDKAYYAVISRCKEFQLIRIFMVYADISVGEKAEYRASEVIQQWIDTKGTCTYMTKRRNIFGYYMDNWVEDSKLEIRQRNPYGTYDPNPVVYPYKSVIPTLKRNGFNGNLYGIAPNRLFCALLSNNKIESLLKMGQTDLFKAVVNTGNGLGYWQSIRVCQRHGYTIKDAYKWIDMLSTLERLGKDIKSPKYIMPTDIKTAHDHWVRKLHEKQNRERIERELVEAREKEAKFKEMKGRFFGIAVSEDGITIKVLDSVRDHILEGKELHHCVGGYALKSKSLILSAVVNGIKTETIEINLNTMEIVQCRGLQNQPTEHHDRIVDLMKRNIHLIADRQAA